MRRAYSCCSGIYLVKIALPIIVKNIFSQVGKWSLSFHEFLNVSYATNITGISTTRIIFGNLPFGLNKENKLLYDRVYSRDFINRKDIFFISVNHTLLIEHS